MKTLLATLAVLASALGARAQYAQVAFGGLLQTNQAVGTEAVDVLSVSNGVPALATVVVFETFESSLANAASDVMTNSSNYTGTLQMTQLDSSVHRQSIYTMYCSGGLAVGAHIGMAYAGTLSSFHRQYTLIYVTGASAAQPNALSTNRTFGSPVNVTITNTFTNCLIVGMSTADGVPTNASGSLLNMASSMTGVVPLISFAFAAGSTTGLNTASYYATAAAIGTQTEADTWTAYGTNYPKTDEMILVALAPAMAAPQCQIAAGTQLGSAHLNAP